MQTGKNMSPRSRANSFRYACNGLKAVMKEPNAILHAIVTVLVVFAGAARHLAPERWIALFFAIGLVWVTEAINTAIERLCDHACGSQYHPAIKVIKDIAAGAVLLAAITSAITGIIIFFF